MTLEQALARIAELEAALMTVGALSETSDDAARRLMAEMDAENAVPYPISVPGLPPEIDVRKLMVSDWSLDVVKPMMTIALDGGTNIGVQVQAPTRHITIRGILTP